MNTLSKSGGVKNSLTPPVPPPHLVGGLHFRGAGGQGKLSGILDSLAVGVVESSSALSSLLSPPLTRLVLMGLRDRTAIPAITHFLDSDSRSE